MIMSALRARCQHFLMAVRRAMRLVPFILVAFLSVNSVNAQTQTCARPCGNTCANAARAIFVPVSQIPACVEISDVDAVHDTEIEPDSTNYGNRPTATWDGPMPPGGKSSGGSFVMMQFAMHSAPAFPHVQRATLWYYVYDPGSEGELHEVETEWSEHTVSYANLPGGLPSDVPSSQHTYVFGSGSRGSGPYPNHPGAISRYNSPVVGARVGYAPGGFGWNSVDVTASVSKWHRGEATNHGWIFLPTGGNSGTGIRTSEYIGPDGAGPRLYIETTTNNFIPPLTVGNSPPPSPSGTVVTIGPEGIEATFLSSARRDRNFGNGASLYVGGSSPGSSSVSAWECNPRPLRRKCLRPSRCVARVRRSTPACGRLHMAAQTFTRSSRSP